MWHLELVFDLHRVLGVIRLYLDACIGLRAPLIFEVKVNGLRLRLLLSSASVLLSDLLLDPCLEPDMEFPSSVLELKSSQVLLISALLVVEGEEETLEVHPHEVALSVEHS